MSKPHRGIQLSRREALRRATLLLGASTFPSVPFAMGVSARAARWDRVLHLLSGVDFATLLRAADEARRTGEMSINVDTIAAEAVEPFRQVFRSLELSLRGVQVVLANVDRITVRGTHHVGSLRLEAELRFFNEGGGVGYTLAFATGRPSDLLRGDLRRIADVANVDEMLWTLSSREEAAAVFAIGSFAAESVQILARTNVHLRFENEVLRLLRLDRALFALEALGSSPSFSMAIGLPPVKLPPALEIAVRRISFDGRNTVSLHGQVAVDLMGKRVYQDRGEVALAPGRIDLEFPVPAAFEVPEGVPFQGVSLYDNVVRIGGRLGSGAYSVGVRGRFRIQATGHGGGYQLEYTSRNTTPVPDMVELSAETLTVSDALNLVSGFRAVLPPALDRVVTLRDAYLYYAKEPDMRTSRGDRLEMGASARASVTMFGHAGYFSVDSRPDGLRAQLLMNPVRIGNVLALRGEGGATPARYSGPPLRRDAIALAVDTRQGSVTGALGVDLLGRSLSGVRAELKGEELALEVKATLPLLKELSFDVRVGPAGARLEGAFEFAAKVEVDLPLVRGFKLQGGAGVSGVLRIDQPLNGAPSCKVDASLNMGMFTVRTGFALNVTDLRDLAERAYDELLTAALEKLADGVEWMKAYVNKAINFVLDTGDELAKLAVVLVEEFGAVAEGAIQLVRSAGGTVTLALDLVREGAGAFGRFVYEEVLGTIRKLFEESKVIDSLKRWAGELGNAAREIAEGTAWLLRTAGFAADTVAREAWKLTGEMASYASALAWGGFKAKEVAKALSDVRATVDVAADIIGRLFGTISLESVLTGHYSPAEITRATSKVVAELGRVGGNVTREIGDGLCKRLGICL